MLRTSCYRSSVEKAAKSVRNYGTVTTKTYNSFVRIAPEVGDAISRNLPVVALESTIISHGMPYPKNFEVAKTVEDTVRKAGAIPATIAIIKGVPTVGLTEQEILALAKSNSVLKASTKDISYACAKGLHAATTVASTMRIAHLAGISVFATGGIGGVHRGAEVTMDVSADLLELSRNPVTVVCAGIKSILDIAKTLEVLETYSVPAVGYKCDEFPAFFTNNSGIRSPLRADTAREVAQMMMYNRKLELSSGILLAVPNINPANSEKMQYAIDFAIRSAEGEGIKGAAITPYLLAKIEKLTSGESLESNVALILNNARIASEIAKEHAGMGSKIFINDNFAAQLDNIGGNGKPSEGSEIFMSTSIEDASIKPKDGVLGIDLGNTEERESLDSVDVKRVICSSAYGRSNDVVVVGGAVIDMIGNISTHAIFKSSNPGTVRTSYGGVGRNIAEMVNNTGVNVCLATAVADDIGGRNMLEYTEKKGIDTSFIKVLPTDGAEDSIKTATAVYNAIHDNSGDLCLGIADMNIFKQINTHYIKTISETIQKSRIVVVDANITPDAFKTLATVCTHYNVPIFFEPTSDHKCLLFFHAGCIDKVDIMKPNISELIQMVTYCLQNDLITTGKAMISNTLSEIIASRIDQTSVDSIDLVDVRILAMGLHKVMSRGQRLLVKEKGKDGFQPLRVGTNGATLPAPVVGKHLIVSLGKRGVLWCGPRIAIQPPTERTAHKARQSGENNKDSEHGVTIVLSEDKSFATCHVEALAIDPSRITHTNGAGDALCAGIISEIVVKAKNGVAGNASKIALPDIDCIKKGLANALHRLTSK